MRRNLPIAPGSAAPAPTSTATRGAVTPDMIRDVCARSDDYSRAFERQLLADHEQEPLSRREFEARCADELIAARQRPSINANLVPRGIDGHGPNGTRQLFADALFARLTNTEAPEAAREYRHAGLVDFARAILEERGERVRWMRNAQVIDQLSRSGLHTTSDFAYVIQNAGQRFLINAFSQVPSPLKVLARRRDFPDFKRRYGVQAEAAASGLRNVPEHGEYKRISFTTSQNGAQLATYGEIFGISRQALINDDLSVFSDMAIHWTRLLSETEASYLVALIAGNGIVMEEDNKTLYHADHGNLLDAADLSVTSLDAARQQMRTIKNRDKTSVANVVPKYLVVGPELETRAEQVLASLNAATVADVNPFSGKLEPVVDPRLTGKSWRLFADPALNPVLEYGNLEGQEGLFTDVRIGFDVDGVEFKARTDLGAGAIDYRGTVKNPGAA